MSVATNFFSTLFCVITIALPNFRCTFLKKYCDNRFKLN